MLYICKFCRAWQKQAIAEQMKHSGSNVQYNEELELRRIVQDNDKINVRVKSHRDEALVREWVQIVEEIGQQRLLKEDADDQRLEIAKKKMLSEMVSDFKQIKLIMTCFGLNCVSLMFQEKLKSIINLDDLDIAIEAALSSEVEYNFAIDASGSVIGGRND